MNRSVHERREGGEDRGRVPAESTEGDREKDVAKWLDAKAAPGYLRLATLAKLSNFGYPPGSEGAVLRINEHGLVIGVDGRDDVPRDFVPWQNVSYISDGTLLAKGQKK
jgi:hypothetical protein